MIVVRALIAIGASVALGCGDNVGDKQCSPSGGFATATSAATVEDRRALGAAAPYVADATLARRDRELATSMQARRAAAWQIVERVVREVPLGDPRLAGSFGGVQPTLPAWHTWYARDDFTRVFRRQFRELGRAGRALRARIDVDAGLAWNAVALDGDPAWPEQRYLDYLASIDTSAEVGGVGGVARVGYSPGALTHLLSSYAAQAACRTGPEPAPFDDDTLASSAPIAARETVAIAGCELHIIGPVAAGPGSVLVTARGQSDADLYVRRGAPPTLDDFDCRSAGPRGDERCEVDGNGEVYIAVFGVEAGAVELSVHYSVADVRDPVCLDGASPRDAVVVKAKWERELGQPLPTFDTSATRMAQRLTGDATWSSDGELTPADGSIYRVALPTGERYRMPALHIMSKELDHWVWVTLWYAPDADADFGADRPAALGGAVWRNYKMCTATAYVEQDGSPGAGFAASLSGAIDATGAGEGAPTWCSNPYLEDGRGNAATNCIGCHQHGGTALRPEQILDELPHHGATRTRNNFFTDYLWAIKGGDGEDLSGVVQAELDFWDAAD